MEERKKQQTNKQKKNYSSVLLMELRNAGKGGLHFHFASRSTNYVASPAGR